MEGEVYYIIYTTSNRDNREVPVYLQLVNGGRMTQSNLYDASKFISRENAEREMKLASEKRNGKKFDVIPIDRRIFGENPRWVEE